jgi:hypothetical protein
MKYMTPSCVSLLRLFLSVLMEPGNRSGMSGGSKRVAARVATSGVLEGAVVGEIAFF